MVQRNHPGRGPADRHHRRVGLAYAFFGYLNGAAISTEHLGGVDKFTVGDSRSAASGAGMLVLTDPLGTPYTSTYALVNGLSRETANNQSPGSGCTAATSTRSYDPHGNTASVIDLNGYLTCYVNDQVTNLESNRVEGLDASIACSTVAGNGVTLPAGSRKVSTEWHPDWRIKTRQAEPGRLTTWVYNGQPDPFAGGTASCAPPVATLPGEGGSAAKPLVVLCKQVEQATTDTDGHLGVSAALQLNVPNRQWSYTYNQFGQVLTAKGPRTDIDDTTRYAYYNDTSFTDANGAGHTIGDLQTVTNALGKVTQYTQYDKSGRLLTVIDPNQVTTSITYQPRGWVSTVSVGGQTTRYDYHPTGLLERVTQPSTTTSSTSTTARIA